MGFSNIIALAILWTAAAALNANGITDIQTTTQATDALTPVAGAYAAVVFALGVVATGLLAIPVFAGSVAYSLGEARHWPIGLARKPMEAKAFYMTIVVATLIGAAINFTPIDPIRPLFWAAVINGVVAVPVMGVMMALASQAKVMSDFAVRGMLIVFGWGATVVMAVAVTGMLVGVVL